MTIQLLKNKSEERCINKQHELIAEIENALWMEDTSITAPTIKINAADPDFNWLNDVEKISRLNYAYIPKFNRYYFIEEINYLEGGIISFELNCDVLMSFKADILASEQMIERCENNAIRDSKLIDDAYMVYNYIEYDHIKMKKTAKMDMDTVSCVLITSGSAEGEGS